MATSFSGVKVGSSFCQGERIRASMRKEPGQLLASPPKDGDSMAGVIRHSSDRTVVSEASYALPQRAQGFCWWQTHTWNQPRQGVGHSPTASHRVAGSPIYRARVFACSIIYLWPL